MKIIYKKVSELIPYVNNPRKNDKAVDAVASSIKNYGFRNAILIDAKNEIINGHTRLKAAQKLGMLEVPCVMAEDLTPAQVKGLRIADNKVAEAAEWDYDLLKIELDDIDDFTGFDLDDFKELDYSDKNKEMYFEEFEDIIELKLKYSKKHYDKIIQKMIKIDDNLENALLKLLEIKDEISL